MDLEQYETLNESVMLIKLAEETYGKHLGYRDAGIFLMDMAKEKFASRDDVRARELRDLSIEFEQLSDKALQEWRDTREERDQAWQFIESFDPEPD